MNSLAGCFRKFGLVHYEIFHGVALCVEAEVVHEGVTKKLRVAGRACQVTRRNDQVGVAVVDGDGNARRFYDVEFLFHFTQIFSLKNYMNVRGSVILPVIALAATTSGEASTVRAPGP